MEAGGGKFLGEADNLLVDFGDELLEGGRLVGGLAVEHLIENYSHRPHITLGGIGTSIKNLRTHVHRTANQRLVNLIQLSPLLVILRKPKIRNLVSLILNQNISRLKIAVNNRMLMQITVPPNKLLNNNNRLSLGQFLPLLQYILQRSLIA